MVQQVDLGNVLAPGHAPVYYAAVLMPAKSKSQQRLFGMAHALQKGTLSPSSVSPAVRRIAKEVSPESVDHFADTRRKGLPEHSKKAGHGFFHLMRSVQQGGKSLNSVSESVASAAKKHIPKDATEVKESGDSNVTFTPQPQTLPTPEVSSKLAFVDRFSMSLLMSKVANITSILNKTHKAVQDASNSHREVMAKELDKLRQTNQKLTQTSEAAKKQVATAEQRQRQAEINAAQAGLTIEQMQAMTLGQRTPPPPEQPAYGSMLLGAMPGQPAAIASQPAQKA